MKSFVPRELSRYIKNNVEFKLSDQLNLSFIHGRETCFKINTKKYLSVKGSGWIMGPPFSLNVNIDNIFLGLLDLKKAKIELNNYKILKRKIKKLNNFQKVYKILRLKDFFKKNKFTPCLLLRIIKSPYRLSDLFYDKNAKKNFILFFGNNDKKSFTIFFNKIINTVLNLHSKNICHMSLDFNNITLAGEIVDLETMILTKKKIFYEKEILFVINTLFVLSKFLNLNYSAKDIAKMIKIKMRHKTYKINYSDFLDKFTSEKVNA